MTIIELFFANWCGHCQRFKPEWQKLKQTPDIQFAEYDADNAAHKAKIDAAGVSGYPTIRIDNKEYSGERTADAILKFIKSGANPQKGGGNDEYYQMKYLKYKSKYLKLRADLGI